MIRFKRFNQRAALCALLLSISFSATAEDAQDGNKLVKHGQSSPVLNKVENLPTNQPKEVQARFAKALALTEQGQTEEAIRLFTALTTDYPELPEPYNNLAVIYASQGLYEKAKVALEMALRTHPSYSTAHENLGDIYAKMASQAYDRALQLDRSTSNTKTKLALIKDLHSPVKSNNKVQIASVTTPPAAVNVAPAMPVATASMPVAAVIADVKPVAVKATVTAASSDSEQVLQAVNDWAKAWSAKNATKYLAMYAANFKTPNNEPRAAWETQRRERISKPQPIVVTISNAKVTLLEANRARVNFVQFYHSGALKATTRKTLEMNRNNGSWQISSEQSGGQK